MKKHYLIGLLIIIALTLLPFNSVYSQPSWHSNTATIKTPDLVVRFFNRQPQYMFWVPNEKGTAVYIVKFLEIVEFNDKDNDGAYTANDELLARAQLLESSVMWNINAEELVVNNIKEIRITMNATVRVISTTPGMGGQIGYVEVSFINHIYNETINIDGYEVEGNKELKIDIIISDWPWISQNSKLAIGIIFAGHFRGKEKTPNMRRHMVREHLREVRMSHEGYPYEGAFRYRDQVKIMENNTYRFCKVNDSEMSGMHKAITYLTYPHFIGVLVHDPSITIIKTSEGGILDIIYNNYLIVSIIAIVLVGTAILISKRK